MKRESTIKIEITKIQHITQRRLLRFESEITSDSDIEIENLNSDCVV